MSGSRLLNSAGVVASLVAACIGVPTISAAVASGDGATDSVRQAELLDLASAVGISMSEAEYRDDMRQQAEGLYWAVANDGANFGGIYSTDDGGWWHIVVRFTGDHSQVETRRLVPASVPVEWIPAKYSMDDLKTVFDELATRQGEIPEDISQVTLDEISNQVVVTLSQEAPGLQKALADAYGGIVAFRVGEAPSLVACISNTDPNSESRWNCTPWRGGIAAQRVQGDNTPGSPCTVTMWAKHQTYASRYLLTAGHCGAPSSAPFWHNSVLIGTSDYNSVYNLPYPASDSRRIPSTNTNTTYMNTIYRSANFPGYPVTAVEAEADQRVGDPVCKSGLGVTTFGTRCSYITALWATWTYNGRVISGRVTSVPVSGGDSGAPFYYAGRIMGLGGAETTDGYGIYSLAEYVQNDLRVRFCLNSDCSSP